MTKTPPRRQTNYQKYAVKTIESFLGKAHRKEFFDSRDSHGKVIKKTGTYMLAYFIRKHEPDRTTRLDYQLFRRGEPNNLKLGVCLDWCDEQGTDRIVYRENQLECRIGRGWFAGRGVVRHMSFVYFKPALLFLIKDVT